MNRQRVINLITARYKQLPYLNKNQIKKLEWTLGKVDTNVAYDINKNFEKIYSDLYDDCDDDTMLLLSIFCPALLPFAFLENLDAYSYQEAVEFCQKNKNNNTYIK